MTARVIHEFHDTQTAGHPGRDETLRAIRQSFHWPAASQGSATNQETWFWSDAHDLKVPCSNLRGMTPARLYAKPGGLPTWSYSTTAKRSSMSTRYDQPRNPDSEVL